MRVLLFSSALLLLAASGAEAFDCGKAKSPVEKAICADPALRASDEAMSKAYADLKASFSETDRKSLGASQRKWIASREDQCGAEEGDALVNCIRQRTDARRHLLLGEPESGPGVPSRLIAVFIQQEGGPKRYDVDYSLVKFAAPSSPGEKAFNSEVDKIAEEAPTGPTEDAAPENSLLSSFVNMATAYASPRLISASVDIWSYDGGAHGNGGLSNVNVDLQKGYVIDVGDVFEESGLAVLREDCTKQIAAQKTEKLGEPFNPSEDGNYSADTITEHLATMERWTFRADKATVTFDPYSIGSFAEGSYICDFPMSKIRAAAKPGAPLPE
jgi:uncharacterized protein YecT (DUF1311 family)